MQAISFRSVDFCTELLDQASHHFWFTHLRCDFQGRGSKEDSVDVSFEVLDKASDRTNLIFENRSA
jgi:hypothetical protein